MALLKKNKAAAVAKAKQVKAKQAPKTSDPPQSLTTKPKPVLKKKHSLSNLLGNSDPAQQVVKFHTNLISKIQQNNPNFGAYLQTLKTVFNNGYKIDTMGKKMVIGQRASLGVKNRFFHFFEFFRLQSKSMKLLWVNLDGRLKNTKLENVNLMESIWYFFFGSATLKKREIPKLRNFRTVKLLTLKFQSTSVDLFERKLKRIF